MNSIDWKSTLQSVHDDAMEYLFNNNCCYFDKLQIFFKLSNETDHYYEPILSGILKFLLSIKDEKYKYIDQESYDRICVVVCIRIFSFVTLSFIDFNLKSFSKDFEIQDGESNFFNYTKNILLGILIDKGLSSYEIPEELCENIFKNINVH
ncbi:MAG: hypothetical protein EKK56_00870 [Flavobacteriaceae bacterium]|nr:MAG: hypothetical protein EKK56_00870 [Flavobacteriaceae bacterium]